MMNSQRKILHIDPAYNITFFIIRPGTTIRSSLSLECAIRLLKKEKLDLILSEPDQKAILTPQNPSDVMDGKSNYQDIKEVRNGSFR